MPLSLLLLPLVNLDNLNYQTRSYPERSSGKHDFMLLLRKKSKTFGRLLLRSKKTYGPRNQTRSEATLNSLALAIATLAKVELLACTASKGKGHFCEAKVRLSLKRKFGCSRA